MLVRLSFRTRLSTLTPSMASFSRSTSRIWVGEPDKTNNRDFGLWADSARMSAAEPGMFRFLDAGSSAVRISPRTEWMSVSRYVRSRSQRKMCTVSMLTDGPTAVRSRDVVWGDMGHPCPRSTTFTLRRPQHCSMW